MMDVHELHRLVCVEGDGEGPRRPPERTEQLLNNVRAFRHSAETGLAACKRTVRAHLLHFILCSCRDEFCARCVAELANVKKVSEHVSLLKRELELADAIESALLEE